MKGLTIRWLSKAIFFLMSHFTRISVVSTFTGFHEKLDIDIFPQVIELAVLVETLAGLAIHWILTVLVGTLAGGAMHWFFINNFFKKKKEKKKLQIENKKYS